MIDKQTDLQRTKKRLPPLPEEERIYLNVPFVARKFAKISHCGFDPERKLWFTGCNNANLYLLIAVYGVSEETSERALTLLEAKLEEIGKKLKKQEQKGNQKMDAVYRLTATRRNRETEEDFEEFFAEDVAEFQESLRSLVRCAITKGFQLWRGCDKAAADMTDHDWRIALHAPVPDTEKVLLSKCYDTAYVESGYQADDEDFTRDPFDISEPDSLVDSFFPTPLFFGICADIAALATVHREKKDVDAIQRAIDTLPQTYPSEIYAVDTLRNIVSDGLDNPLAFLERMV